MIDKDGLAHCEWYHPYAGGTGVYKKARYASPDEQASEKQSYMAPASVPASKFLSCFEFFPWLPSGMDYMEV